MSRLRNFDEVIEKLRGKLIDYLEDQGINTKINFACIHPDHNDDHPSCGIVAKSDFTRWHCFGCGQFGDIFDACSYLEGKPSNGPDFIEENVLYLAKKYGVEIQMEEPTEEEKYRIEIFNAYKKAAHYIANNPQEQAIAEMRRRGWNPEGCKIRLIGGIDSFDNYKQYMKDQGFSVSFLESIDLLRRHLFNEDNLIFTVCDGFGRPCGFGARNLRFDPDRKESAKYINSKNFGTEARCQIYEKSKRLYNIHNAKKTQGSIYVMEGYGDVETAIQAGLENTVCVGGTSFTDYHIIELGKMGKTDITICMDGDEKGQESINRMLEKFSNYKEFSIYVVNIPDELDPDDFIRERGIEAFYKLRKWTAFEWKLNTYDDRIDTLLIRREVIPIIAAEPSPIAREEMAKTLAERVEISAEAILDEVNQILNQVEARRAREQESIINTLITDLKICPTNWRLSINKGLQNLETATSGCNEESFTPAAYLRDLEFIEKEERDFDNTQNTFELANWREMSDAVKGDWTATLNVLGGRANCGKCLKHDSEIVLADGSIETIEKVVKEKISNGLKMKNHKIILGEFTDWIDSGKLECFNVKTKSGLETEPSETHPYYTLDGWKQVKELNVGDRIAIVGNYSMIENKDSNLDKNDASLIGLLLSDGSTTSRFGFSNIDNELVNLFKRICLEKWNDISFRYDSNTYYVSDLNRRENRAINWGRELNIMCNAHEKRIPNELRKANKEAIATFLGSFYACDGWFYEGQNDKGIGLSLCNKELLKDVRHLLLRFNIKTSITESTSTYEKGGERFPRYTIYIRDAKNIINFYNNISIPLEEKQKKLNKLANGFLNSDLSRHSYQEYLPAELWKNIEKACNKKNWSLNKLFKLTFGEKVTKRNATKLRKVPKYRPRTDQNINPTYFKKMANLLGDDFLISIAESDIFFDEIVEIKSIGEHQCYDLTVPEDHNFVCNDTVVHNTALMSNLAMQIASFEDSNDVVLFHTIDDTVKQFTTRLICQYAQEQMPNITLNMIKNPNGYPQTRTINRAREYGYSKLRELVSKGRLIVRGGEQRGAATLTYAEDMIKYYKKQFEGRRIVYMLDNFHRLRDFVNMDERLRFKALSNATKDIAKREKIGIWATMEYNKASAGHRPDNNSIAESVAMEYDANLIAHVYNELHDRRDEAELYFTRTNSQGQTYKAPRIELIFGKNKLNEFKSSLYFDFHTEQSRFAPVPTSVVKEELERIKKVKEEARKERYRNYRNNNANNFAGN